MLPEKFLERLKKTIPTDVLSSVENTFEKKAPVTIRVNTLQISVPEVIFQLQQENISFSAVPWFEEALILEMDDDSVLGELDLIKEGKIYRQGLSSMVPVIILDPRPGENILDMCAAPGSKTTQMAAVMNNEGSITALEVVRNRFYKLKSVTNLTSATNVTTKCLDARKFRSKELFDRVLVDAPCSSEGRFKTFNSKTFQYWSTRKIKEMVRKQRGLLLAASRLVKPGGILVYSTCTFAPEENEGVVDWFLRKTDGQMKMEEINLKDIKRSSPITKWGKKEFNEQVQKSMRILPNENMEGFFVAKFVRR